MKQISIDYKEIRSAERIEEILCLAVLNANGYEYQNVEQAKEHYSKIGCENCPYINNCLACFLNK